MTRVTLAAVAALALFGAACTVKDSEAPAMAGPSELALALNMQATPDTIFQQTGSQATVSVEARGPNGQPARGVVLRLDMLVNGQVLDWGTLSAKTIVTGDDGRARAVYNSPPAPAQAIGYGTLVSFLATPVGGDYNGQVSRQVDIRVVPPGTILPIVPVPVPSFTFSPAAPRIRDVIRFDATMTTLGNGGVLCGSDCSYQWDFGDRGTASGQVVEHEFHDVGTFTVTLRVTNQRGDTGVAQRQVAVAATQPPTAQFVFSPTQPRINQDIFFNAEASRAATGRRIVYYAWDFGSGRTGEGVTTAKAYGTPGTYVVTLTVTDDADQTATVSVPVTVIP